MITTFQAIVYSVLFAVGEFFPVGSEALLHSAQKGFSWEAIDAQTHVAMNFGALLALAIYYRHDLASLVSSFFQVVLFRRKPHSFDEMLVFLILIAYLPVMLFRIYGRPLMAEALHSPAWIGPVLMIGLSLIFLFLNGRNKRNRNIFSWNPGDAAGAGLFQVLHWLPGGSALFGTSLYATSRNYHPTAIVKFSLLALFPILLHETIASWGTWESEFSWLTFSMATLSSLFAGLIAIGAFNNAMTRKGPSASIYFRMAIAGIWLILSLYPPSL